MSAYMFGHILEGKKGMDMYCRSRYKHEFGLGIFLWRAMQIRRLDRRIDKKLGLLLRLRNDSRRRRIGCQERFSRIVTLEMMVDSDVDKLVDLKRWLTTRIDGVSGMTLRRVLHLRYIDCMPWHQILHCLQGSGSFERYTWEEKADDCPENRKPA